MSMRTGLASLILAVVSAGCCSGPCCGPLVCVESPCYLRRIDQWHTDCTARRCAWQAIPNDLSVTGDYRNGFTQAFRDVARGADGTLPPIPPERYWDVCFRSGAGHARAQDWFAGYRDGAEAARAWCGETCRTIASSGTGYHFGPVRSSDIAPCGGQCGGGHYGDSPCGSGVCGSDHCGQHEFHGPASAGGGVGCGCRR